MSSFTTQQLKAILEAVILAAGEPVSFERLRHLFEEHEKPGTDELRTALIELNRDCAERGVELKEVASGFCFQAKAELGQWVKRLWQEKPPRYSRALLETLAVIAYRQPITRAEIEAIRGVSVSSNTIKLLLEREWIRIVGQREVPGRPSLYATTRQFLDYFNLQTLEDLPALMEVSDLEQAAAQLEQQAESSAADDAEQSAMPEADDAIYTAYTAENNLSEVKVSEESTV